jgi:SH3-like domain-containing protein
VVLLAAVSGAFANYRVGNTDAAAVHMRQGPSNRTTVIAYIPPQTIVARAGDCQPNWCRVAFKDKEGWVFRRYLIDKNEQPSPLDAVGADSATAPQGGVADEDDPAVLRAAPANGAPAVTIREFPGDAMPVVGTIPANSSDIVDLKRCVQSWCLVRYGDVAGWVANYELVREDDDQADATATPAPAAEPPPAPKAPDVERTAALQPLSRVDARSPGDLTKYVLAGVPAGGSLVLRRDATDHAAVVGSVPSDAEIFGLKQCVRQWCLVQYRDASGYILRRHLARADAPASIRYRVDGVSFDTEIEVHEFPGRDATVIGTLPSYATGIVPIGNCDREWCHVRYFGIVGWVGTRFLVIEQPGRAAN